jgi:hypothetical protein
VLLLLLPLSVRRLAQESDGTVNIDWVLLQELTKSGHFTKTPQADGSVVIGTTLIWAAAVMQTKLFAVIDKELLSPWPARWELHERTVMATALLRMQLFRHVLNQPTMTLLQLRPHAHAADATKKLTVLIPAADQLEDVQHLFKHSLFVMAGTVPQCSPLSADAQLPTDITGSKSIKPFMTGGVALAADNQPVL